MIALSLLKYIVILREEDFDFGRAPNFFIVLLAPIVVGLALLPKRVGAVVIGLMALLFLVITVSAMVRLGFNQQNWSDALLVFLGAPISLIGVWAAARVFRATSPAPS